MKQKTLVNSIIIIITFLFASYGKRILSQYITISFSSSIAKLLYIYLWWIIPSIIAIVALYGYKNILKTIGINKGFLTGFIFAAITVSPMLISSAIIGEINSSINIIHFMHTTIIGGTMEELFFRGFLFGILFNKLKWGFIPAAALGAVIFGLGHLYQASNISQSISVFLVTFMGAAWFAWLYIEWDKNLWVPIFLHTLMNVSWILFEVSNNAIGNYVTNTFRIVTIAATIIITIRYHKKRGLKINKRNLITNVT